MAEDKTFRYGLIVLGLFLVMVGMFIMSVEKPQIYISFCTLGVLVVALGIIWSMCQCYPKIRVVSVDSESEKFLVKKPAAATAENKIPGRSSLETPYTSQEEADIYEKSLPSYDQIQMKEKDSSPECRGKLPDPVLSGRTGAYIQPVQAKVEVHQNSESHGDANRDPATMLTCPSERFPKTAPLASLQEEIETSSLDSAPQSPFLQRWKEAPDSATQTRKELRFKHPSYDDFTLMDSLTVEGQGRENTVAQSQSHPSDPIAASGSILAIAGPGPQECNTLENVDEDDMYYGIKEGPGENPTSFLAVEPKS